MTDTQSNGFQDERAEELLHYLHDYRLAVKLNNFGEADYYWRAIVLIETGVVAPPTEDN